MQTTIGFRFGRPCERNERLKEQAPASHPRLHFLPVAKASDRKVLAARSFRMDQNAAEVVSRHSMDHSGERLMAHRALIVISSASADPPA
jgi:hypothetical protein